MLPSIVFGQTTFHKTFSGSNGDYVKDIRKTEAGGFVLIGHTLSFGAGSGDIYVLNLDALGNKIWDKTYGGSSSDFGSSITTSMEGGYVLTGSVNNGLYVAMLDDLGDLVWERTYGGGSGIKIEELSDTTYVIGGQTTNFGSGAMDFSLLHIDKNGNVLSSNAYGGVQTDQLWDLTVTQTGDILLIGLTYSFGSGEQDGYVIKTDVNGDIIWTKVFATSANERFFCATETTSGSYIFGGSRDVPGGTSGAWWLVKTDNSGNIAWSKTYDGYLNEYARDVIEVSSDSGFGIVGNTGLFGKLDFDGDIENTIAYENYIPGYPDARSVVTNETGFLITGEKSGADSDIFLIQTNSFGMTNCQDTAIQMVQSSFVPNVSSGGVKSLGGTMSNIVTQNSTTAIAENIDCYNECNLTVELEVVQQTGGAGCDGEINLSILGGSELISFQWDENGGNQTTSTISNLCAGEYCVSIIDSIGCQVDSCITVSFAVDVHSTDHQIVSVYPNPATLDLHISSELQTIKQVNIYNSLGKLVHSEANPISTVNLSGLVNGTYLLVLEMDKGWFRQKLIIE